VSDGILGEEQLEKSVQRRKVREIVKRERESGEGRKRRDGNNKDNDSNNNIFSPPQQQQQPQRRRKYNKNNNIRNNNIVSFSGGFFLSRWFFQHLFPYQQTGRTFFFVFFVCVSSFLLSFSLPSPFSYFY